VFFVSRIPSSLIWNGETYLIEDSFSCFVGKVVGRLFFFFLKSDLHPLSPLPLLLILLYLSFLSGGCHWPLSVDEYKSLFPRHPMDSFRDFSGFPSLSSFFAVALALLILGEPDKLVSLTYHARFSRGKVIMFRFPSCFPSLPIFFFWTPLPSGDGLV